MNNNITFQRGDRVGFVYNNELKEGTFVKRKTVNKTDVIHVDYQKMILVFSSCSVYPISDNGKNKKNTKN